MYLNVSEMGKGIFGAEAASQSYFRKPASKLSRREAALIAACLPNPKKYSVKPLSDYVAKRSSWVIKQMNFIEGDIDVQAVIKPETVQQRNKKSSTSKK